MRRTLDTETLSGAVAVVTGAASGIGFALAESCAMHHMRVLLADVEGEALERAVLSMKRRGARVDSRCIDVRRPEDLEALAEQAFSTDAPVKMLFNNAGVGLLKPFLQTTLEDWRWILDVNLWGVIHGMRAFLPHLATQSTRSWVVNTASAAGLLTPGEMSAYNVSKHGVVALTETVQREMSASGAPVQFSVICPSLVRSRIHQSQRNRDEPHPVDASADQRLEELGAAMIEAMSAEEVSRRVFAALEAGRFLVTTHDETPDEAKRRVEDLVAGLAPTAAG